MTSTEQTSSSTGGHRRTFIDKPATRERVPLLLGLIGPSGGGKTYSALRVATGIQRVSPGEIFLVDTEARRGLHYADKFKFRHVVFAPPFGSLDYLAAIEHCVQKGAGTIIVDSMSHEHEGPGGLLEQHEAEIERLLKAWKNASRDTVQMTAWAKPKAARRRMINTILQLPVNFIFCFRAKDKVKIATKEQRNAGEEAVASMGFMPIAGEEFVFEMVANALLMPGAGGVPTWYSKETGEKKMIKLPEQFRSLFGGQGVPLNEEQGEAMAKWAAGDALTNTVYQELLNGLREAASQEALEQLVPKLQEAKDKRTVPAAEYRALRELYAQRKKYLAEQKSSAESYDDPEPPAVAADADPEPGSNG